MKTIRRIGVALAALVAFALPVQAQNVELTARGSGYYRVYVADSLISQHVAEREAVESVINALVANPGARAYYVHDYTVDAEIDWGTPPAPDPDPEPTPNPTPDPDPEPEPQPQPDPGAWRGNEPAGMTTVADEDWVGATIPASNEAGIPGTELNIAWNAGGHSTVVTRTGPNGTPSAQLQRDYVPGLSGNGVGDVFKTFSASNDVYVAAMVQYEPDFEWNPVSQKLIFFWEPSGSYNLVQTMWGVHLSLMRSEQNTPPTVSTDALGDGSWHLVEALFDDGLLTVWLDGRQVNQQRYPDNAIAQINWDSTWGGGGNKRRSTFQWTDRLYISVRN